MRPHPAFCAIASGVVLLAGLAEPVRAEPEPVVVSLAELAEGGSVALSEWQLSVGDDPAWASPEASPPVTVEGFDGSFRHGEALPDGWEGIGWLRCRVQVVEEGVVGLPLGLLVFQTGASEVYVDGQLVGAVGSPSADAASWRPRYQRVPILFSFDRPGEHLIAVRFANPELERFHRAISTPRFRMMLSTAEVAAEQLTRRRSFNTSYLGWFAGIFLSFAFLHLMLFAFYPEMRENLYFAFLCLAESGLAFLILYRWVQDDPRFLLFSEPAMNFCGLGLGLASLAFVYRVFYGRFLLLFWVYAVLAAPVAVWSLFDALTPQRLIFLMMLAASVEMIRTVVVAVARRKPGAWLVGLGVLSLAIGFGIGLSAKLDLIEDTPVTGLLVPFAATIGLMMMMSVYLAWRFSRLARDLARQLGEVERLSEEKLEQERRLAAEEVERQVLETRYRQKVKELDEARELQLSMLPAKLPEPHGLELAAYMQTAEEVGGDYYDFDLAADGTLTVAIGDATGHGMRAGTMVTATKSLFRVLVPEGTAPVETLARSTSALKSMNLKRLAMALTLAQIRDGRLRLASAGMPPALLYRAATGEVESLLLGGMPLGSLARFPYREHLTTLAPGDTLLLMSDGYPERLDGDDRQLGYEQATAVFTEVARGRPAEIIEALRADGDRWAGERPTDDDVTFVVVKAVATA